jgi:hypothetical protein
MKRFHLIFSVLTIAVCYGFSKPDKRDYALKIEKVNHLQENGRNKMLVKVTLTNKTNDTLKSWWDFYRIDNKKVHLDVSYACDKNTPVKLTLAPHTTTDWLIKLYSDTKQDLPISNFKLGIMRVKYNQKTNNFSQLTDIDHPSNMIWSNVIGWDK